MGAMSERVDRRGGRLIWLACVVAFSVVRVWGQDGSGPAVAGGGGAQSAASAGLVDAPGPQQSLEGSVVDPTGAVVVGAQVALKPAAATFAGAPSTTKTDADGAFRFEGVAPGVYEITIMRQGFADQILGVQVLAGQSYVVPPVTLGIAAAATEVNVVYSTYAVAEEEVKAEEHQRVLGIIPNFGVSYVWHAAPLTAGQKFRLAWRSEIDPISFVGAAVGAGYEQAKNYRAGYGQGAEGYAKRFGASYVDGFDGAMLGGAILPAIFHQDPRYYYMGKEHGTVRRRVLYAIATVAITRGDNGRWQPNYSNVLGNLSAGAISNLYYPASDRGAVLTIDNALLGTLTGAIGSLIQEFVIKHISTGVPKSVAADGSSVAGGTQAHH